MRMPETRVKVIQAEAGKIAVARLQRDTDLVSGLVEVCKLAGFEMACTQIMIGSLRCAELSWTRPSDQTKRGSERTPANHVNGPIELIAGQAEICLADPSRPVFHVHVVITDPDGKVWGGHAFQGGNPVHSTVDVVLTEIKDAQMKWVHDEEIDLELPVPFGKPFYN